MARSRRMLRGFKVSSRRIVLGSVTATVLTVGLAVGVAPSAVAATGAPAGVRHAKVTTSSSSRISLSWTNPSSRSLASVVVRVARGGTAPSSATRGSKVATVTKPHHVATAANLTAGTAYTFAIFASDGHKHFAKRVT